MLGMVFIFSFFSFFSMFAFAKYSKEAFDGMLEGEDVYKKAKTQEAPIKRN
jgi:hypothetical protein